MKRNVAIRRAKSFVAGGLGRHGPYVTYVKHIRGPWYGKASYGTMGPRAGVKYSGRTFSAEGRLNLSQANHLAQSDGKEHDASRISLSFTDEEKPKVAMNLPSWPVRILTLSPTRALVWNSEIGRSNRPPATISF